MPMLPPMLRIRLNRLVALPIRSRGIDVHRRPSSSGTNSSDMPGALQQLRPEDVPVARLQVELDEPDAACEPPTTSPSGSSFA